MQAGTSPARSREAARKLSEFPAWRCPQHGMQLASSAEVLSCVSGHMYPVVNGIPRFVPDSSYADHFDAQWKRYRLTQLDSYTGHPITADRLRRCLGEDLWRALEGKMVLECGCGAGRFTEVLLARGAQVASIDLTGAIDANVENFPISDRHICAQADLMELPWAEGTFDIVLCLGVLQHTLRPEQSIQQLAARVRPGGYLVIDHYAVEWMYYTKTAPLVRMVLKRLQPGTALRVTERMVKWLLPIHKRFARSRLRSIIGRISPVLTHYVTYPELSDEIQTEWAMLDTHDSLTDWYKHRRRREQIVAALRNCGLENIECWYGGNGVEARAQRS